MSDQRHPSGAVFLSYARENGEAARRIAEALRAFGVEVWFDMSELRGGDAWDQKIRRQIKECALFIPLISAHSQAREEGYFRREWKLAVDRTHDMAENRAFIVPVIIDATRESDANVPEQFLKAHCTRLPNGEPTPQFVEQVKRLLQTPRSAEAGTPSAAPRAVQMASAPARSGVSPLTIALGVVVLALVAFVFLRPAAKPEPVPPPAAPASAVAVKPPEPSTAPAFAPDAKSIAVLPFVNMSTDADQGFFADGLAEELLNLLAKIPALHVTSRSSAFSYKGKDFKLAQVARELNVAHILEGSVRKSGNRLRITAQLIDARTDTHLWSETYDRSLDDIFAVQDEIAAAVAGQLKITLLGEAPKTKAANPKAYALFLQARQLSHQLTREGLQQAVALYQQALAIDLNLVAAWNGLAECYMVQADFGQRSNEEGYRLAREAAQKAIALDPNSAGGYALLGINLAAYGDLPAAAASFAHALALEPANTDIITVAMKFARGLGRYEQIIALGEYVVAHDPLNTLAHATLGGAYIRAGRYDDGMASMETALRLAPGRSLAYYTIAITQVQKGDPQAALAAIQKEPGGSWRLDGSAIIYYALGRKAESDAALAELIKNYEKEAAWNIAYVYAFRGEADRAFEWLEKAIVYRDPGLSLTAVQPQFANLRSDPRWLPFLRRIGVAPEQLAAIKFDVKLPAK
jgi:TolB-like protein/Flp pilus assembly protein TadD